MAALIEELQRDALNWKVPVTELLQRSLVVATKLNVKELADWARLELDGYAETAGDVPKYRVVAGVPQVFNPYRGYQPLTCDHIQLNEILSSMDFVQPISEIEFTLDGSAKNPSSGLHFSYSPELSSIVRKGMRPRLPLQLSMYVDASQLRKIVEAVRRTVLEWSLRLEAAGIIGDGMSFSSEEKEKAQAVTYNIDTYITVTCSIRRLEL